MNDPKPCAGASPPAGERASQPNLGPSLAGCGILLDLLVVHTVPRAKSDERVAFSFAAVHEALLTCVCVDAAGSRYSLGASQ